MRSSQSLGATVQHAGGSHSCIEKCKIYSYQRLMHKRLREFSIEIFTDPKMHLP